MLWGLALLSFAIAAVLARLLSTRLAGFALDEPNARSMHAHPIPRSGGIAVLAGSAPALAFGALPLWLPLALGLALAAVSLADDLRGVPTVVRLPLHLAAAVVLAWLLFSPMHPVAIAMLGVAVAWITNVYNFMDGSDGLAGGMGVIGFATYAAAALFTGHAPLAAASLALATACAGFLLYNFHPARVFLGDVGAIPLGFLVAALGLQGWRDHVWPLWFPILVFAPFIGDTTLTLIKRLVRGERVSWAHRDHYYQRMVRMGLGHRGTAWVGYCAMLSCAIAALAGRNQAAAVQATAFVITSVLLGAMAVWVDLRWARFVRRTDNQA
jgi:UDP-N-acetylmuramyl pentapeptide phosphotransferase/UDP-N-acetylglucosamine-1-phosphate transferase